MTLYDNKSRRKIFMSSFITRSGKKIREAFTKKCLKCRSECKWRDNFASADRKIFEIKRMSAKGSSKFPVEICEWEMKFYRHPGIMIRLNSSKFSIIIILIIFGGGEMVNGHSERNLPSSIVTYTCTNR